MNSRAVGVQGGLALAGLISAYLTWQRQPELMAGEVFAVDIPKGDLEKVRYEDPDMKLWSEVRRDKDAEGTFIAVQLSGSDASGAQMPAGHPVVPLKVPDRTVRGNDSAQRLFERLAPLRATRALGVLDKAKLKDLGLDTTKKRLEIVARGTKRKFAIAPAPPGGSHPYVRDEGDGRVYIIDRSILQDMQSASANLVERRMHSFKLEDVDRVVVSGPGGKKKEFKASRVDPQMPGIRLTPAGADKPDDMAKNWHDKVWNLFPAEVLGKGEVPKEGPPAGAVRVEYFSRGRPLGWTEVSKPPAGSAGAAAAKPATPPDQAISEPPKPPGATPPPPSASDALYARSEFTLGWVKLPQDANTILPDAEKLLDKK
jgi:hypothetical protein